MAIAGILASGFMNAIAGGSTQNKRADFAQLGSDLQSGNLTSAQQDFAQLLNDTSQSTTTGSTQSSTATTGSSTQVTTASTLASDFKTLGQALQSGDLTGAQKAYSAVQQDAATLQQQHQMHRHQQRVGTSDTTADGSSNSTSSIDTNGLMAILNSSNANAAALYANNSKLGALSSLSASF